MTTTSTLSWPELYATLFTYVPDASEVRTIKALLNEDFPSPPWTNEELCRAMRDVSKARALGGTAAGARTWRPEYGEIAEAIRRNRTETARRNPDMNDPRNWPPASTRTDEWLKTHGFLTRAERNMATL
jgi:hypothetical protein